MATLYEIDEEILNCVDMETGEIIDVERLGQLQLAREDKVEGIALWIKNLLSDVDAIKSEEEKLAQGNRLSRVRMRQKKHWRNWTAY